MTLSKTISFCYLGLLYTEDSLLLTDMHRFITEGKIPYINIIDYFPPTIQLQRNDYCFFRKFTAPSLRRISRNSTKLFDYLDLPKFKHRRLSLIMVQFVKDLNLPDCIMPIIKILLDYVMEHNGMYYDETKRLKGKILSMPVYELQVMASIIIALKLVYTLDGKSEKEHSEAMMKINTLKGQQLFVWSEWQKQASLKEYLFLKTGPLGSDLSLMDSLMTENIITKCNLTHLRRTDGYCKDSRVSKTIEGRNKMKVILEDLVARSTETTFSKPSSFPLKSQLVSLMRNWQSMRLFKETEDIDFTFISRDFSSHLLFYKDDENASEAEDLIDFLLSTINECVRISNSTSDYRYLGSTRYWIKNPLKNKDANSYTEWLQELPHSFSWLLKFLSKYLDVHCKDLYTEVLRVERLVFGIKI